MSRGIYLHVRALYLFFSQQSREFKCNICRLQGHWQLYFPSLYPSLPPAWEIDRPFVGSSNGAGERIRSSAGSSGGQRRNAAGERGRPKSEALPTPGISARDLEATASTLASEREEEPPSMPRSAHGGLWEGRVEGGSAVLRRLLKWVQIS